MIVKILALVLAAAMAFSSKIVNQRTSARWLRALAVAVTLTVSAAITNYFAPDVGVAFGFLKVCMVTAVTLVPAFYLGNLFRRKRAAESRNCDPHTSP